MILYMSTVGAEWFCWEETMRVDSEVSSVNGCSRGEDKREEEEERMETCCDV